MVGTRLLWAMLSGDDLEWIDSRLQDRSRALKRKRLSKRNPDLIVVDAGRFASQLSKLAQTMVHKMESDAAVRTPQWTGPVDIGVILRQLKHTYDLLLFINADDTRFEHYGYRTQYSFVSLPLVRTMIDGFYNCTAMLDEPRRARKYRISGYYRLRESLEADEARYSSDERWKQFLRLMRDRYEGQMRADGIKASDLDDNKNKWPLLGVYLDAKPDSPHKQTLRRVTQGFWKEYSSISHTSFDGLMSIFPFIGMDRAPHHQREAIADAADRHLSFHIFRASAILLSLLTEIQYYFKFNDAEIDQRLADIWGALLQVVEVKDLYDYRYKGLLRKPITELPPNPSDAATL